jgi:hypothetical protein
VHAGRRNGDELATVVPFDGGPWEEALRSQTVQVVPRVFADARYHAGEVTLRPRDRAGAGRRRPRRGRSRLADDATLLIIDWHGRHGQPRNTRAGADLADATSADAR